MAGKKLTSGMRLQASTIVEVIISMVIILVVFGLAMVISANVTRTTFSARKLKAISTLEDLAWQASSSDTLRSAQFTVDSLIIHQEIKNNAAPGGLIEIRLTAFDGQHEKIAELQKFIRSRHE